MTRRTLLRSLLVMLASGLIALVLVRSRVVSSAAGAPVPWSEPRVERDLEAIRADTLRILVLSDPLTWEQRPQAQSGLEWELLERIARRLDIPVRAVPLDHPDSLWMALQEGKGDIIAAQLTPRADHARWVDFSRPYRTVRPVLATVYQRGTGKGKAQVGPVLDSVLMAVASPFRSPAYPLNGALCPVEPDPVLGPHTSEQLFTELLLGRTHAVVVSDAHAAFEVARTPLLSFSEPIGPPVDLCFAVRRNGPALRKAINEVLEEEERNGNLALMTSAYRAKGPGTSQRLRAERSIPIAGDSVSPYDRTFRSFAGGLTWDWHLLVAMAYQESRFDSTASSTKGAFGIMQFMPRTAERMGLGADHAVDAHVAAAVRYINKLDTLWRRAVPDPAQRLRFVLASYNAGPGHIIDAQRLAEQLGLDHRRWEGHVERTVLLLARPQWYTRPDMRNGYCKGSQVFHYVRDVVNMYTQLTRALPKIPTNVPEEGSNSVDDAALLPGSDAAEELP
ncbi:MAG: transporter substrate-binding domain-containing protein [Elusimicrobia bacterium]|nr:MAG: transporter substrate-binding domain-containing protein [Elusimicrobiota bacterium]